MATPGSSPRSWKSLREPPEILSASGSAFVLIGLNSQEKPISRHEMGHAPSESMLYSPGIGPAASMSTEMKHSLFISHQTSGSEGTRVGRFLIASQWLRNSSFRSSIVPVVFQCNAPNE